MKRLALVMALVAMAGCQKAEQKPAQTQMMQDTSHMMMADTSKMMMMGDTAKHMMMADTSKKMTPKPAMPKKK